MNEMWGNLFRKSDPTQEVQNLLKGCFLFQDLSSQELGLVKDLVHSRHFKPGESVFRQGEVGIGMYIISKGNVEINVEDTFSKDSTATFVTRLHRGDFFGELSLVEENSRRTATALASDEAVLVGFFKPDLEEIIERSPSTGIKITHRLSQVLGRRLSATSSRVTELKKQLQKIVEEKK